MPTECESELGTAHRLLNASPAVMLLCAVLTGFRSLPSLSPTTSNASRRACPRWHYENELETRAALDLIFSDFFSRYEPGIFSPLRDVLLTNGDYYMHLADFRSYHEADQRMLGLYAQQDEWACKAILNIASSG